MRRLACFGTIVSVIICFCCISACCESGSKGYSVRVNLQGQAAGDVVYLKRYSGNSFSVIDSMSTDKSGTVLFQNRHPLTEGMYSTGPKGKKEAEFFISDGANQHFSVAFDPDGMIAAPEFSGSPENEAFALFLHERDRTMAQFSDLKSRFGQWIQNPDSMQAFNEAARNLQVNFRKKISEIERQFNGTMLALYLRAGDDPEISDPEVALMQPGRENDLQEYYYYQTVAHFFDNIDFSDNRQLKIPHLSRKLDIFFRQVINPHPDSVMTHIDNVLGKALSGKVTYAWVARFLYNMFRESPVPGHSVIPPYIGNRILANSELVSDSAFIAKVRERIAKDKLNPAGSLVTNLKLQDPGGKTIELHSIRAPFTILYFFNPGCDACHPVTGKLYDVYSKSGKTGIVVYAIYLDRNREEWLKYIAGNKLDWINVYDMNGTEGIEQKFDIHAIPMIYILDEHKNVIARDVQVESIESYISGR